MKNVFKSTAAVAAGFVAVVVLSVATDLILEKAGVFPPQEQPGLYVWWMLTVALAYRSLYTVAGGYITAALAPNRPMFHAVILAAIGLIFGTLGTVMNWDKAIASGTWYPIAVLIISPLCVLLGAKLKAGSGPGGNA